MTENIEGLISNLTRFYQESNLKKNESYILKIEQLSKLIKFDFKENLDNNLYLKQLNYNGKIYHLLFSTEIFIGFTRISILEEKIELELLKINLNYEGNNYGTLLVNNIMGIVIEDTKIKEIRTYIDETYSSKGFYKKLGFKVFGNEGVYKIR